MYQQILFLSLVSMSVLSSPLPQSQHNLPVLFQFSHPTHNVAVYRGAQLKQAIAAGLVSGFGSDGGAGTEAREGRSEEVGNGSSKDAPAPSYATPTTTTPPPPPPTTTTAAYVAPTTTTAAPVSKPTPFVYTPAPIVYKPAPVPIAYKPAPAPLVYKPALAPIVYKPAPAPIVYKPAPAPIIYKPAPAPNVYKPAPTPIVYKPAPAPIVYKPAPIVLKPSPAPTVYKPNPAPLVYTPVPSYKAPSSYVEPSYADIPAKYDWEYSVKDDYTNNDFGAKESRDGYLTNGKYYVALPDGRLQTVTYVVDGEDGYVPVVKYEGEAQYPPEKPAATYSA